MIYKLFLMSDWFMFEYDELFCVDLLLIYFLVLYENGKLEYFFYWWMKNCEYNNFWLIMFLEKRYF